MTQQRPVAKNATWESNSRHRESSATLCQLSHEGRCWERVILVIECEMAILFLIYPIYIHWHYCTIDIYIYIYIYTRTHDTLSATDFMLINTHQVIIASIQMSNVFVLWNAFSLWSEMKKWRCNQTVTFERILEIINSKVLQFFHVSLCSWDI